MDDKWFYFCYVIYYLVMFLFGRKEYKNVDWFEVYWDEM